MAETMVTLCPFLHQACDWDKGGLQKVHACNPKIMEEELDSGNFQLHILCSYARWSCCNTLHPSRQTFAEVASAHHDQFCSVSLFIDYENGCECGFG
jgi:hypothetical protein